MDEHSQHLLLIAKTCKGAFLNYWSSSGLPSVPENLGFRASFPQTGRVAGFSLLIYLSIYLLTYLFIYLFARTLLLCESFSTVEYNQKLTSNVQSLGGVQTRDSQVSQITRYHVAPPSRTGVAIFHGYVGSLFLAAVFCHWFWGRFEVAFVVLELLNELRHAQHVK